MGEAPWDASIYRKQYKHQIYGKFWKHLFQKVGTKLSFNVTFHPQMDGQTKRVDGVLNQYLRNYVNADQKDWGEHLGLP